MDLPVMPPIAPMLAKAVPEIPDLGHTEPKWDGFRSIVFRDNDDVVLGSRNERPLTRYFPELVEQIKANTPTRCVLDGEIVIIRDDRLDFDALQQRIHPAESRVRLLAEQTPAAFIAFDLLAHDNTDLMTTPFRDRRALLTDALADAQAPVYLTPATDDLTQAHDWFHRFEGAGLDGVVAKPLDGTYQPNKRAMFKIKHAREADVVLAGYRLHKSSTPAKPLLGSLLLGLYDDAGQLQFVGVAASFPAARRAALVTELAPLVVEPGTPEADAHPWSGWKNPAGERMPGAVSRWSSGKDLSFTPLRVERVLEVAYDHMEGTRFRHTAQFRRWRDDRDPATCTYEQLVEAAPLRLSQIFMD
ncbi:ATP-dependent DNA ligase [Cellulosimicrobium cellulans]|uniref:ATP-dependent DNA ligase n=1 Tax=Cellulosimicrobium cellulans TaxID=1710 RepID=UPI0024075A24|nr:ATP-dependent DNA ligase [Cellulosimicrobium cellulans]MDF9876160.1 ATP-dependent DNA ligase [Cellulosimicrobium cellulans]